MAYCLIVSVTFGQRTLRSRAPGDWSKKETWEDTNGVLATAPPDLSDDVTIRAGHTVRMLQKPQLEAYFVKSLQIEQNGKLVGEQPLTEPSQLGTTLTHGSIKMFVRGPVTVNGTIETLDGLPGGTHGAPDVRHTGHIDITIGRSTNATFTLGGAGIIRTGNAGNGASSGGGVPALKGGNSGGIDIGSPALRPPVPLKIVLQPGSQIITGNAGDGGDGGEEAASQANGADGGNAFHILIGQGQIDAKGETIRTGNGGKGGKKAARGTDGAQGGGGNVLFSDCGDQTADGKLTLKSLVKTGANGRGSGEIAQGTPIDHKPKVVVFIKNRQLKDDGALRIEAGECEIDFGNGEVIFTELLTDAIRADGDVLISGCGMIDLRGAQPNCIRSTQGGQVVFRVVSATAQILLDPEVTLDDLTDPDAVVIEDSFSRVCASSSPPCVIPSVPTFSSWGALTVGILLLSGLAIKFGRRGGLETRN